MHTTTLTIALATALLACGTDTRPIAIQDLPAALNAANCRSVIACDDAIDETACEASYTVSSDLVLTEIADVDAGKIKFDGTAAGACVDWIANEGCEFTGFRAGPSVPCSGMFTGTVAPGGACMLDADCANLGTCTPTMSGCDAVTMCCPGTCTAAPTKGPIGTPCADDTGCTDDLYCADGLTGSGTCAAVVTTAGAACGGLTGCANPLLCDIFASSPTCEMSAATGATCNPSYFIACADLAERCDETTLTCVPRITVGMACDPSAASDCVLDADCDAATSKCLARLTLGETCVVDSGGGSRCVNDLVCTDGTCALPAAGMACH